MEYMPSDVPSARHSPFGENDATMPKP